MKTINNWQALLLGISLVAASCTQLFKGQATQNGVSQNSAILAKSQRYMQSTVPVVDTVVLYSELPFFSLTLKNTSGREVYLTKIASVGEINFTIGSLKLPFLLPQSEEVMVNSLMNIGRGVGWYEGTMILSYSDGSVEYLSRKIFANWIPLYINEGITRYYKEPFPTAIKDNRIFADRREIKADVKFLSHYYVLLNYANTSDDTIYVNSIEYNKAVVSFHDQPLRSIPPKTSSSLVVKIELGSSKVYEESLTITFRNRPPETIFIKLSVDYLDDLVLTRFDTLGTAPLFGGKQTEYQSEIAFANYVKQHIDQGFFESYGIYDSKTFFRFYFTVNASGQVENIKCSPNKFPVIEKSLVEIIRNSGPWKPSQGIELTGKANNKPKNLPAIYRYQIAFNTLLEDKW